MHDAPSSRLFRRLDRVFWLIWLAFPVTVAVIAWSVVSLPDRLAALAPGREDCFDAVPQVGRFSPAGQGIFWALFAVEFAFYAALLALAHVVIHRCARGRVFVAEMIGAMRTIGILITAWPFVGLALHNAALAALAALGDVPAFEPDLALDVTVVGIGLLFLTIAAAMDQAVRLREEADLTI